MENSSKTQQNLPKKNCPTQKFQKKVAQHPSSLLFFYDDHVIPLLQRCIERNPTENSPTLIQFLINFKTPFFFRIPIDFATTSFDRACLFVTLCTCYLYRQKLIQKIYCWHIKPDVFINEYSVQRFMDGSKKLKKELVIFY